MKYFIIISNLLFITTFISSCVTPLPKTKRTITKIIETNKSQDDLFTTANIWLADSIISAETTIEYADKKTGILRGNGIAVWHITPFFTTYYQYSIKIDIKNNRAKIELMATEAKYTITQSLWNKRIKNDFETIIADFEQSISAKNDTF